MNANSYTRLSQLQRGLFRALFLLGTCLVANTAYLSFAAHVLGVGGDPDLLPATYQVMLVVHLCLGVLAAAIASWFISTHARRMYRQSGARRLTGLGLATVAATLVLSGCFILSAANTREHRWVFVIHQAAALLLLMMYGSHRWLSRTPPTTRKAAATTAVLVALVLTALTVHLVESGHLGGPRMAEESPGGAAAIGGHDIASVPFHPVGDPQRTSPFYPSNTTTATGGLLPARILTLGDTPDIAAYRAAIDEKGFAPDYFVGAQTCARCHMDIVGQWLQSAHRFSSFNNPFYRKAVDLTRDTAGVDKSQFCAGCHDPVILLPGDMLKQPIDYHMPELQAGLTCLSCHAIDRIHNKTGNGNYNLHDSTTSPYAFELTKTGIGKSIHDYLMRAKPAVHKRRMLQPFFRQSEFCLTCHKVNLDVQLNGYHWLRGQNEYDAWQNSGYAHSNPATWYEPPEVRVCQDCHMPRESAIHGDVAAKNGMVRSHRFLAANTALPYIRGDAEALQRTQQFLQDRKMRVDIFALHREDGSSSFALNRGRFSVRPGERVQLDVVVRNLGVGHTFPGGTNDTNEGWVDFSARLGAKEVFHSGAIRGDRTVDPSSHFFQAVLVDRRSQRISRRNVADVYAPVYVNVIGPGAAQTVRYSFTVPPDTAEQQLEISAALNWRKFNQQYTDFIFDGKDRPELPVTVVASDAIKLAVSGTAPAAQRVADDPEEWKRFNDYAIGLFLSGDLRGALPMFRTVAQLQPKQMDGWLNQARTFLEDGDLANAEAMLRKASDVSGNNPRVAFFWGRLHEKAGRLELAGQAYRRALQAYPDSRAAWSRLGRVLWLAGDAPESIQAYREVLRIDPEDAAAFQQLSFAYRQLAGQQTDQKRREEYLVAAEEMKKAFEKYKIDENAARVTEQYRLLHPEDNRMAQRILVHEDGG